MAFPEAFLEELLEKNPIEEVAEQYVSLTRKGSDLFGLCPFHNEKTASFSVAPEKGLFYCFGCHRGGGVIQFIKEIEGLDYPDAVRFLAKRAGIEVPVESQNEPSNYRHKEKLWQLCRDAAKYYHETLKGPEGQGGRSYLLERGLTADTIVRFGLGFAPDCRDSLFRAMREKGYSQQELQEAGLIRIKKNQKSNVGDTVETYDSCYDWFRNRIMFPIIDVRGNVIGFGSRVMDGSKPKYLNSPESIVFNKRKNLFALNLAKKSKMGMLVLTEGYMDAITMHQYGFDCAAASLGTSLTQEQANILAKYTKQMILCYDSDEAGQNASKRAIEILEKAGVSVRVLQMQGAKDPDEFLHKYGVDPFRKLLQTSEDQAAYQLKMIQQKYDLSADDGRVEFLQEAAGFLATMSSPVEQEVYSARVAEAAKVSLNAVKGEVQQVGHRLNIVHKKHEERLLLHPADTAQPAASGMKYENIRSAMAEEGLLGQLFLEPVLLQETESLQPEDFSVPLFARVFAWMRTRWQEELPVSISAMDEEFQPEEISHITRIYQKMGDIVNERALQDYISVIRSEALRRNNDDLRAAVSLRREKKGW